jgi:Cytochrome c oxidase subunit IV
MKIETRVFLGVAAFLFACAIVYAWWTESELGAVEVAGTTALVLSGGLAAIVGSYFWFVSRRIELRPEDRADADIAEGAGELGFFSPGSYWPFALGLSAALGGLALAFWELWFIVIAGAAIMFSVGGLLFEYYTSGHTSPVDHLRGR